MVPKTIWSLFAVRPVLYYEVIGQEGIGVCQIANAFYVENLLWVY